MATNKGNKVELTTFKKWGKTDIIGSEIEEKDGKTFVVKVWCKLCGKHSNKIQKRPECRGSIKTSIQAFIKGTNSVTKHQVDRPLSGQCHSWATELEKAEPIEVCSYFEVCFKEIKI